MHKSLYFIELRNFPQKSRQDNPHDTGMPKPAYPFEKQSWRLKRFRKGPPAGKGGRKKTRHPPSGSARGGDTGIAIQYPNIIQSALVRGPSL